MFQQRHWLSHLARFVPFLMMAAPAHALRIDEFISPPVSSQVATSEMAVPTATPSVVGVLSTSAIGGARVVSASASGGPVGGALTARVATAGSGTFFHSQDAGISGSSMLIWDGGTDGVPTANGFQGGAGINLLQDFDSSGGVEPKIAIVVDGFDLPSQGSGAVSLQIQLFDAANSAGLLVSTAVAPLLQSGAQLVQIPRSQFIPGALGYADWSRIGAISLTVIGALPDADLSIGSIKTNGLCDLLPDAEGRVIDECGVCGGDNSSCADCQGVPNGPALPGTTCSTGQVGVCAPGVYSEGCGCVGALPSNELCDGLDNDCDGSTDENFPALDQECSVGSGVCSQFGVFVCSQQGGLRCDADVKEPLAQACEASKGCDGVPNSGLVVDQCGVCGGDGTSCLDCAGTFFGAAQVDRCGECNGTGMSCLGCSDVNLTSLLTALDGGAKQQERTVKRIFGQLGKYKVSRKDKALIRKLLRQTHALQIRNWTLSWTVPTITTTCTNQQFCVASSSAWIIDEYRRNSETLRQLAGESFRIVQRIRKGRSKSGEKLVKLADAQHAQNLELAATVPLLHFSCSQP